MLKVSNGGLHHVGYVVKDLEATVAAMEKTLGELSYKKYSFKPMNAWCEGKKIENYELKIAMIAIPDRQSGIEIIEPVSEGYHKDFVVKTNGGGINHICFETEEYDKVKAEFESAGAKFVFESETEDETNGYRRCFYAEDTVGDVVEIKEKSYFRKEK